MLLEEVERMAAALDPLVHDEESGHVLLDDLWEAVLTAIATGQCQDASPADFARVAVEALNRVPQRWYA